MSFNTPRSWISIQPAFGINGGLERQIAAGARPANCQFSARWRHPIGINVDTYDSNTYFLLSSADGAYGLRAHITSRDNVNLAAIRFHVIAGGGEATRLDSLVFDTTPTTPFEVIMSAEDRNWKLWVRTASVLQLLQSYTFPAGQLGTANALTLGMLTQTQAPESVYAPGTPFAPIYQIDYLRQRDDANVF